MSLRDLFLGVNFEVNERELRAGDNAVDELKSSTKSAGSAMRDLDKNSKRAGVSLKSIGKTIGAFVGIHELGRGLKYSLEQASDLAEETDKFNTVFGDLNNSAAAWAEQYAKSTRASVVETRSAIAENQNLLVGFGATRARGFELSKTMQMLAGDLSAMNNIEKDIVSNNLQSVMLGQHQAGKTLGLAITEASLQQEALNAGYTESFRNLDPLIKMELRLALAMKQSQDSIGKAASEADTFAGKMRGMKAFMKDTAAEAGSNLMPVLGELQDTFYANDEAITNFIVGGVKVAAAGIKGLVNIVGAAVNIYERFEPIVWGLGAAFAAHKVVGIVTGLMAAYSTAVGTATAAQAALNIVMGLSPFGMIALGIGAVVAGTKLMYDNFVWFRRMWDTYITPIWDGLTKLLGLGDTDIKVSADTEGIDKLTGKNDIELGTNVTYSTENRGRTVDSYTTEVKAGDINLNDIPGYANGTENAKPGFSIVGEKGPELKFNNGGEKIINNNDTKKLFSNKTTKTEIVQKPTININIDGAKDPKEIARIVKQEIDGYFKVSRVKGGYAT